MFVQSIKRDLRSAPWNVRKTALDVRHISNSTGDPEVLRLGLEWLKICQNHHSSCKAAVEQIEQKNYFPKRLLDVGTLHSEKIWLIVTDFEAPRPEEGYATLSHCWGKIPSFIRLTTDNLPALNIAVNPQDLPRSFHDAVVSCRRLGVRYLWIDSLCILQCGPGAEEDWHRHVGEMHVIYANCVLNIGIAHASNPEQGAFVDRNAASITTTFVYMHAWKTFHHNWGKIGIRSKVRDPSRFAPLVSSCSITTCYRDTRARPRLLPLLRRLLYTAETCLVTVFAEERDYYSALKEQPLSRRGWVFQERLMAPRTLIFGSDRIYWRCHERMLNEYLPYGLPQSGETLDKHGVDPFSLPGLIPGPEFRTKQDLSDIHGQWYELVQYYSQTDLTFPEKDKLAAIAAIGGHFGRLLPGRYCAGRFESDLHFGSQWIEFGGQGLRPG